MNTKSDWQSVNRELMATQRQELGEPPTLEELQAYLRGELSPQDEERVRDLLVCYPDLARALVAPFPTDDAQPGEPGYVSDMEMERRWKQLQSRVGQGDGGARVLRYSRGIGLIAAIVVLCFGAVLWRAQTSGPRVIGPNDGRGLISTLLMPSGQRGLAATTEVKADGEPIVLVVALVTEPKSDAAYRIALYREDADEPLWQTDKADRPGPDDTFRILVPARFLTESGNYQIRVWQNDGTELPAYSFRVKAP